MIGSTVLEVASDSVSPGKAGVGTQSSGGRSLPRWLAIGSVAFVVLGCGGQSSGVATPKPTAVAEPKPTEGALKPAVEVMPAPPGLFMIGRITGSDELVSKVGGWCSLPFGVNDGLSLISEDLPKIIDLNQSIDVALSLAPEPDPNAEQAYDEQYAEDGGLVVDYREPSPIHAVVSLAVTKPDDLVAAFTKAEKEVVVGENGDVSIEIERDLHCVMTASAGPTTHRLACGAYPEDVAALASYVNTALVTQTMPPKGAYLELRMAPLRERFGNDVRSLRGHLPEFLREVTIGNERFDRAMAQAAPAIVEEIIAWFDGIDTWNFSLDLVEGRDSLVAESTVHFRKPDSYVADVLRRGAAEAAPAPRLFWDLPHDVDAASFSSRITPNDGDKKIASNISELLAGALEHGGVAAGTLDNWVNGFRSLMESRGTVVVGAGAMPLVGVPGQAKTTAPKKGVKKSKKGALGDVVDALGYYLIGVEGDAGAYAQMWRSSVATFNDKRLRAELAKALDEDMTELPLIRTRKVNVGKAMPAIELYEVSYKVPKDSAQEVFKLDKVGLYLAMATAGERTWFGMGFSEAAAVDPVKLMVAGGDYPKLGTREGLTALHEHRVLHGSFATLNSYAKVLAGLPFGPGQTPFGESLLRAMPHHGTTPLVFEMFATAQGPAATARMDLPREAFEDGSALTVAVIAAFTAAFRDTAPAVELD